MAVGSKSFPQDVSSPSPVPPFNATNSKAAVSHDFFGIGPGWQVAIGYVLLQVTLWTASPHHRTLWMSLAGALLLMFTVGSGYSRGELGLEAGSASGALRILIVAILAAAAIPAIAVLLGQDIPANPNWPPARAVWEYAIWAMVQQFILQSFFYVRLETVLGAKRAVLTTALLFATAHLPNPILTIGTLVAGLFMCEMFRRYRSIYPLGIVHAALGLALAESVPDRLIHHLRVGTGYLHFHVH